MSNDHTNPETLTVSNIFDGTRMVPSASFALPILPATKTPFGYQVAAIENIWTFRRVILGLAPGLGKTLVMSTVAANEAAIGRKTLITVPPALLFDPWAKEFSKDFPDTKMVIARGTKAHELPADADVVIMADSLVAARIDDIVAWAPHNLMSDEAHRFKSPDSKRTKAMHTLAECLPADAIIVMATGTISVNNAGDVFNPLYITGVQNVFSLSGGEEHITALKHWNHFLDVWCETELAWKKRVVVGCEKVELLRKRLIETCMINIDRDLCIDLPARTFNDVNLAIGGAEWSRYKYAMDHFLAYMEETFGTKAMERSAKAEAMTRMMRLWELDGQVRAKVSAEYVSNLVKQGEQVVVMAHHATVIDEIRDRLEDNGYTVRTIRGGMSSERKAAVVADFQAGIIDVIVGQVEAAGVGITLTASCHIVFAQLPWSPASFAQACDRIYRIGQERPTFVHVLLGHEKMLSQRVWNRLHNKAKITDAINNGKPVTMTDTEAETMSFAQSIMQDLLEDVSADPKDFTYAS